MNLFSRNKGFWNIRKIVHFETYAQLNNRTKLNCSCLHYQIFVIESKKYSEKCAVLWKVLCYTMLYAPHFSHTPLYRPHISNTDSISIVFDGK